MYLDLATMIINSSDAVVSMCLFMTLKRLKQQRIDVYYTEFRVPRESKKMLSHSKSRRHLDSLSNLYIEW